MNDGAEPRAGWIARTIAVSATNPWLTVLFVGALALWGWYALVRSPLDAIPDLSDVQVIVFTEWPGQSPDIVEDQVTYPLAAALLAAPRVAFVRGQSMFGMSFLYVIFDDGTDLYWARSRVLEYLDEARARLPEGVTPTLGPDATGVGWVYQYALVDKSGRLDLQELRSLQDWNVRFALESVPGVAEVASVGGFVKEYQIVVDPLKLEAFGIPIQEVVRAVRDSNQEVGGQVFELAEHEVMVRGRGWVKSRRDLELVPLRVTEGGVPVRVADVAQVRFGPAPRRGFAELDGLGEAVGGIVVMRHGENALAVIDAVEERLEEVKRSLPEGVELVVTYDRSGLIRESIDTLTRTLAEQMLVVSLVIFVFLLHARSSLVAIVTLPVAVLVSFIPMSYQGLTINIMSLGGIAVAIGELVDASIIVIENVHKRLERWEAGGRGEPRQAVVVSAMQEVGPSLFFSLLVMTVSFLPVFTLQGVEGRLFKPLAFTKSYSMGFGALLAVTLTPALAALFIRGRIRREEASPLNRWLIRLYTPVVRFVVRWRWAVVAAAALATIASVPALLALESEFMPPLHEGAILYMPTAPPGMGSSEAVRVLQDMDRKLRTFPEVVSVFGKMGRAETATDPAPIGMVETVVVLKPREEWRPGLTWDGLIAEMDAKLSYPGMPNIWWMPIQTRTEMLSTGIRAPLGVKVLGDDLATIERAAVDIERAVSGIPGTRSAFADRSTGGFYLDVEVDREAAARYGVRVADVQDVVASAIGGLAIAETVEGRQRYPIAVRYARGFRDDPRWLERVLVASPTGAQVALRQVARITFATGPPMIRSEDGRLVGYVFVDPGERPLGAYVEEAPDRGGAGDAAERRAHRVGRPIPALRARQGPAQARGAGDPVPDRAAALPQHPLGGRGRHRAAGGALLADRRGVAALAARLQPERRGLGGPHRARRPRRRDRGGDAALSEARLAPEARGRAAHELRGPARGDRRGRGPAHPAQADDHADDDDRPAAGHVVLRRRRRRDEANRGADVRRHRHLVPARADGLSGDLRALEAARIPGDPGGARRGRGGGVSNPNGFALGFTQRRTA